MPPPNTPNEPSGASSPTSTRPSRTPAEPSRTSTRIFSSETFVRDLETILAGPTSPAGSASGSATPSASTTPISLSDLQQQFPGVRFSQLERRQNNQSELEYDDSWYRPEYRPGWTPTNLPLQTPEVEAGSASSPTDDTPHIDWQGLEYTSQVDENLLCGICKNPFYKPWTTKACGHTFCEYCLCQHFELARGRTPHRAPCPLCRTELNDGGKRGSRWFIRVVEMSAQLDRLEVRCPNNTQFCKWAGPRSNLEGHVKNECDFTLYPCPDSSCPKKIIRKSRGTVCRHHEGPCAYCEETVDLSMEVQHHMTACAKWKVPCGLCGKEVARDLLLSHQEDCSVEIATCPNSRLGCSFSCPRKDVLDHEKTCVLGPFASLMESLETRFQADLAKMKDTLTTQMEEKILLTKRQMDSRLQGIQEELQEEARKREELAQKLSRFERVNLRLLRYRDPAVNDPTADVAMEQAGQSSLPLPEDTEFEQAEYMFRMFDELDTRISNISKALIDQDARHSVRLMTELMPVKEQLVEARSQLGVMGMHVRWLMDLQRSRQRQAADVVGGLGGGGGGSSSSGSSAGNSTAQSSAGQGPSGSNGSSGGGGPAGSSVDISRRMSDRVNPVRPSL